MGFFVLLSLILNEFGQYGSQKDNIASRDDNPQKTSIKELFKNNLYSCVISANGKANFLTAPNISRFEMLAAGRSFIEPHAHSASRGF